MPTKNPNDLPEETKDLSPSNAVEVQRFIESLNQAMVMHSISQRKLGDELGVSIGTITKYLRAEVNPYDVRSRITRNLAALLGVTTETLYNFYDTGEFKDRLTIKDVESWIRVTSESKDLPRILSALSASQRKLQNVGATNIKPERPTDQEVERFGELLGAQFRAIAKEEVISQKEAWQLFLKQEFVTRMNEMDLELCQDVLRGDSKLDMNIILKLGANYGRCPITTILGTMSTISTPVELSNLQRKLETFACYELTGALPKQEDAMST